MSRITGSVNLSAFKHIMMNADGQKGKVRGIFIPLEANKLKESEKGEKCVYLNIVAFPLKERKEWATHIVKQSLSKEVREAMTEEETKAMPILGNLDVDNSPAETTNNAAPEQTLGSEDKVPF